MKTKEKNIYIEITQILHSLGLPAHILGHNFLRYAILAAYQDTSLLKNVTNLLYPKVAIKYATSVYGVEKGIRSAIETAWLRGDRTAIDTMFGNTIDHMKAKPGNKEFIAMIVDELNTRHMK